MINHVEMINWRAYEERAVDFGPGITFIMGANGIGKTSILEAVAYGLTGQASTVKERGLLLRDPTKLARVKVKFTVDEQQYLVERSEARGSADRATLTRLRDGKQLASSHRRVTEAIERLMGVSSDFLQRIIYMAEGDVFRFIDKPPGQALDLQIRHVLGLTQLDEFMAALDAADKQLKEQIREIQGLLQECERLGARDDASFDQHVQGLEARREQVVAELRAVQGEITTRGDQARNIGLLADLLDKCTVLGQRDRDAWPRAQLLPVPVLLEEQESRASQARAAIEEAREHLAQLRGQQSAYQEVLDILQPYAGRTETLPCPVCGKPLTPDERERAILTIRANLARTSAEAEQVDTERAGAERWLDATRAQLECLRELRSALLYTHLPSVRPDTRIADLIQATRREVEHAPARLEERARELEQQLRRLESDKAQYLAVRRRIQDLNCASPEDASSALVGLETRSLSLRAAHRAAQETLTTQRNLDMEAIYGQVSRVWGAFCGEDDWRILLDSKGRPRLEDGAGHRLDLTQFSGGEKTALLIMLHTIIAHHFSRSDFLLIDEPLEHLDPVNRRSLIRFLVGSYRRGSFQQAIIATFEESLIRKYMSEQGVNIIHLS